MILIATIMPSYNEPPPFKSRALATVVTMHGKHTASVPIDKNGLAWQFITEDSVDSQMCPSLTDPERTEVRALLMNLLASWPRVKELQGAQTPAERVMEEQAALHPNDAWGFANAQMPRGETINIAKRLGIYKSSNIDDWWVGYSPRNGNVYDEGTWAEWVQLAHAIIERNQRCVDLPQ